MFFPFRKPRCVTSLHWCSIIIWHLLTEVHIILLLYSIGLYLDSCYTLSCHLTNFLFFCTVALLHTAFKTSFHIIKLSPNTFIIFGVTLPFSAAFSFFMTSFSCGLSFSRLLCFIHLLNRELKYSSHI